MYAFENTPAENLPEFIKRFETSRSEAMRNNDAPALRELLAPGFVFVHGDGEIQTREEYLRSIEARDIVHGQDMEFAIQHNYQEPHVFIVVGLTTGSATYKGRSATMRLRSSSTWLQHERGWQSIFVQMTPIAQDVPEALPLQGENRIQVQ